jgi:hypothetical protein
MWAVLADAMAVYRGSHDSGSSQRRRLFRETARWLGSRERSWPFSFVRICEALDLDPDTIRRGLRARRARLGGQAAVQERVNQVREAVQDRFGTEGEGHARGGATAGR